MQRKAPSKPKTTFRSSHVQHEAVVKSAVKHPLMALHQSIGNRAVQRLIQSHYIQAKLQVSKPGDPYEQEADRVADKVMRMPDSQVNPRATVVQGKAAEGGGNQVSQGVQSQIESFRGGGQPLLESTRAYFEPRFGRDFGGVRIHDGTQAAEAARSINAQAFTVGRDVAFATGQYSPETSPGKRLLAHELTHVIQQNGETPSWLHSARQEPTIQRQTGTDYGLALPGSQNKYVAEAVKLWTTKKTMKIEDFVDTLMNAIKTELLSQGAPEFKWQMSRGSGLSGSFDSEHWIVNINPDAFSTRQTITQVQDLTLAEVQEIVATLYHESRHTDQDLLIIRVLLDQKKAVKDIVQETKIPQRIVDAVKGTTFKTPPDAAQAAHATRMFAVMYGQHKELLEFLMKNSQAVAGVQELVNASNAQDLTNAAPHVQTLADWKKNVLEPKVKQLGSGKAGPVEARLKIDLGALNQATANLLVAFAAAAKMKNPTGPALAPLRQRTNEWQKKLMTAYSNLEGEKDAFAVEESVKKAFQTGATAKPTPAPTKK